MPGILSTLFTPEDSGSADQHQTAVGGNVDQGAGVDLDLKLEEHGSATSGGSMHEYTASQDIGVHTSAQMAVQLAGDIDSMDSNQDF